MVCELPIFQQQQLLRFFQRSQMFDVWVASCELRCFYFIVTFGMPLDPGSSHMAKLTKPFKPQKLFKIWLTWLSSQRPMEYTLQIWQLSFGLWFAQRCLKILKDPRDVCTERFPLWHSKISLHSRATCATMQQIQTKLVLAITVSHGSGAHHLACGLKICKACGNLCTLQSSGSCPCFIALSIRPAGGKADWFWVAMSKIHVQTIWLQPSARKKVFPTHRTVRAWACFLLLAAFKKGIRTASQQCAW